MEFKIKDITDSEKEIEIIYTQSELEPYFEKAYREYQKKIELPGFRKGKAPIDMIKKIYGEGIEYESLEKIANDSFQKTAEEQNINFIGTPALVDMDYKKGESVTFKIKYEITPNFELKNYKGLEFEKLVHEVTEEEVQDEIDRILFYNAEREDVQSTDGEQYIVHFDVQELDENGTPLIGRVAKDQSIYLADKHIYKEFKDALMNCSVGDMRNIKLPQHENRPQLNYQLQIKKIEKIKLPELNDEFIKKITQQKTTSVEEFTQKLRNDIEDYWEDKSRNKLLNAIKEKIVSMHEFSVPNVIIDNILNSFLDELKERYPNRKLPQNFDIEKFRQQQYELAKFQAKWLLIREKIIQAENLQVEDSDIEKFVNEGVAQTGIDRDRLFEYYKNSPELKDNILSQKVNQILLSQNKINEIVTDKEI
ncbi:MAG: Cell division trigger factor [Ignavibacteriae bacterium]|nr:MAG: Cell division trigger factor [Ignavibacteriota bacterium]